MDEASIAFAGIYELWRNSQVPEDHEDAWYWSASIITTQATDDIGRIHDRTPMVIAPETWADWLNPANNEKDLMLAVMRPATSAGSGGLASHPVSTAVNSVRNNGPSLIEPSVIRSRPVRRSPDPPLTTEDRRWKSALPVSA